jgi:acetyl-CoA carboxylase carboxyltransferase component
MASEDGWQRELDDLRRREAFAEALGGPERVRRQHDGGRLTIRERIARLADPDTFHETGKIAGRAEYDAQNDLVGFTPSNFVFGRAAVDGRPVVIGGDDFTVRGGSADATIPAKHVQCERMAHDLRLPLLRLVEGSGGGGSVRTIETTGRANVPALDGWEWVVANLGTVPRVALGLGSVAGLGAAHLAAAHYSVMVKGLSALFVAGPPVVERVGQKLTKEELGGWEIALRAGSVDDAVDSEEEAFARVRRFLSYLPSSIDALPPRGPRHDDPGRRDPWLLEAVPRDPRKPYRMRRIVESVVDQGSFFEVAPLYGRSVITGYARLDGWPVALMAGDPYVYGGAWDADTCRKVERFLDIAETFHLPVAYLVDCPGFLIGLEAERAGTIKEGVRVMAAMWQTTVPWCAVIARNAFGVAGAAHRNQGRYCLRYAWPSGRWGSLPLEGGIEAAYRAELDAAADPAARMAEIEVRLQKLRSPFRSAEAFWIEEIVDPRETRPLLCEFANLAAPLRRPGPSTHPMRP